MDWTDPGFLEQAERWIRVNTQGVETITQPHVQPWSTVLKVSTPQRNLWFKAVTEADRYSVPLTQLLAEVRPDLAPELVAADPGRRWMLMTHGGVTLRELDSTIDQVRRWEVFLPEYAELQMEMTPHYAKMASLGVPPMPLAELSRRTADLLDSPRLLLLDEPDGLSISSRDQLRALLPDIELMCLRLAGYGIRETVQHDDLNSGNVYLRDGRYRAYDWGDACLSHPFHTLTVTLRSTAYHLDLEPGGTELQRMRDAYLEPFTSYCPMDELVAAARIAYRTGTLARALSWARYYEVMGPQGRREAAESVAYGLQRFLEARPIGSWRWD